MQDYDNPIYQKQRFNFRAGEALDRLLDDLREGAFDLSDPLFDDQSIIDEKLAPDYFADGGRLFLVERKLSLDLVAEREPKEIVFGQHYEHEEYPSILTVTTHSWILLDKCGEFHQAIKEKRLLHIGWHAPGLASPVRKSTIGRMAETLYQRGEDAPFDVGERNYVRPLLDELEESQDLEVDLEYLAQDVEWERLAQEDRYLNAGPNLTPSMSQALAYPEWPRPRKEFRHIREFPDWMIE